MKIVVQRKWETEESICGMMMVDEQEECFTLERPRTGDHPCIPTGQYEIILTFSPHLHYLTPEVLNVPNRSAIRIHIANRADEILGCTAIGETHTLNFVGESKCAFDSLMTLLKTSTDPITIEYIDPPV
jgi:Family of unknown function (DUF5675)